MLSDSHNILVAVSPLLGYLGAIASNLPFLKPDFNVWTSCLGGYFYKESLLGMLRFQARWLRA